MFVSLSDTFHADPRIVRAGNEAAGVYSRGLSYCAAYATDGFVSAEQAKNWTSRRVLAKLVDVGLFVAVTNGEVKTVSGRNDTGGRKREDATVVSPSDGFFLPDLLTNNPTADEYAVLSAKKRDAANTRWGKNRSDEPDANADSPAHAPVIPVPGPASGPVPAPVACTKGSSPAPDADDDSPPFLDGNDDRTTSNVPVGSDTPRVSATSDPVRTAAPRSSSATSPQIADPAHCDRHGETTIKRHAAGLVYLGCGCHTAPPEHEATT